MEERVRAVLGPKWALEILSLLAEEGSLNYTEIEDRVPTSSDIVSKRLQSLSAAGLIDRIENSPRNVEYEITDDGKEVLRLLREISTYLDD